MRLSILVVAYALPLALVAWLHEGTGFYEPVVSTAVLALGALLWIVSGLQILSLSVLGSSDLKAHAELQAAGRQVRADILHTKRIKNAFTGWNTRLTVGFTNLSGEYVHTALQIADRTPADGRFVRGKHIALRLNERGTDPAFAVDRSEGRVQGRNWTPLWFVFHAVYAVVLFVVSYALHSQGNGWRFLSFAHPWLLTSVVAVVVLAGARRFLVRSANPITPVHELRSFHSLRAYNELLLHGQLARGAILDFKDLDADDSDNPNYHNVEFWVRIVDKAGNPHDHAFKQRVHFRDVPLLKRGVETEILWLPRKPEIFTLALPTTTSD